MAEVSDSQVEFRNVQKSYDGETLVVQDLDLEVRRGEFLTLLGPSGSGKTTTLMLLAGFEMPTRGAILLDGRDVGGLPPHRRGLGLVFQNYALFPHMTVAENLAFPLKVRRLPTAEVESKVKRALEMVKLGGFGARRPAQLSGGQQQRVALARALVFEPKLVLMDEPLGALDKQLREHMQLEIKHLHQQLGVTVVYVTHDQGEALTMSDRIAIFDDGAIQQLGTPHEIYESPATAFVAQFIGENNRIAGRVSAANGLLADVEVAGCGTVKATLGCKTEVGNRTLVSLRPERVTIDGAGHAGDNRFPARVEEVIYLGDHVRLRVNALGRDDFVVKLPAARRDFLPDPGDSITVAWRAEDCRALDLGEERSAH
ncbi:MAG: ABC transporter ATP-binding protein [Kiloniellales bacterium]